jgi:hypothetical protein
MFEFLLSSYIQITKVCTLAGPCTIYTVAECKKGDRDCFPEDRVPVWMEANNDDDRGSGRRRLS